MIHLKITQEIFNLLFDGAWEGGNQNNYKIPHSRRKLKTFEDAVRNSKYICGKIKDSVIMEDFDDVESFQTRLSIAKGNNEHCIVIQSPNRGGHFYWFNPEKIPLNKTKQKTVLTFYPVDYKCGIKKNKSSGEIVPAISAGSISNEDGTMREVIYCNIKDDGTLDELPFYDLPMESGEKHNFLGMGEGDGRQDGLFTFMNPMKSAGYSYEQYVNVAEIINRHIFSKPMDEDEFKNAIRQDAWKSVIDSNKKDFNPETFKKYLEEIGMSIKYNELLNIVEFKNVPKQFQGINDVQNQMPTKLQYEFCKFVKRRASKNQMVDLISLEADINAYNPVRDYLQSVKWDGVDRFPAVYNILGITDPLQQTLVKKWFYQTVALPFNAIDDPIQPEGVLILQGKEGIGKTRFFKLLIPDPSWFSSLDKELSTKNKDILIQTLATWVSEIGEIDRTFKANRSDVKNFMTSDKDTIRKPYAREPITKARTTSFCGTTNKAEFLNDDTGYRRWWVIPVNQRIITESFTEPDNLHQFWAQCHETYIKDKKCFLLTEDERKELEEKNDDVMEVDPIQEQLTYIMDFDIPKEEWTFLNASRMKDFIAYGVVNYPVKEIGRALTRMSQDGLIEAKKVHGNKGYRVPFPKNYDQIRSEQQKVLSE